MTKWLLVGFIALFILVSGCTTEPNVENSNLCSNDKYSTEYVDKYILNEKITIISLTSEDESKLAQEIEDKGNVALKEVSNFLCLESLYLNVYDDSISDLSSIAKLNGLKLLALHSSGITDASALSELENLEHLDLSMTKISDTSVFTNLKKLKELYLVGTDISSEDCESLKETLPNVEITC